MQRDLTDLKNMGDSEEEDEDDLSEPPEPSGSALWQEASNLLESKCWSLTVTIVIVTNITLMTLEAQYEKVRSSAKDRGAEIAFLAFFLFEISLRIYVHGCCGFFWDKKREERYWNWGDFIIVVLGVLSMAMRPTKQGWHAMTTNGDDDLSSCLLLLRGLRIIRVIRLVKGLRQLQMLIRGMIKSFSAVFWILVLGLLIILFFAVSVTTIVGNHSKLWSPEKCSFCEPGDQQQIEDLFGDLGLSMWTMFQFVTLDDWASIIQLVSKRIWIMRFFFLTYTLIASFALISLLTGVMAEQIMNESSESQKAHSDEDITQYIDSLRHNFVQRDNSPTGKGGLTLTELTDMLEDPKVTKALDGLGLARTFKKEDIKDAFSAMDLDGDEMLTWDEFNKGLKSITGPSSARQVALVRADVQRLLRHARRQQGVPVNGRGVGFPSQEEVSCSRRLGAIEERMARLEAAVMQLVQAPKQGTQASASWQPTYPTY